MTEHCSPQILFYFAWFGILVFLYHLGKFLHAIHWTRIRGPHNLLERYGKGSYAVITGSTAGIGQGFAHELARRGFNIVLIARNADKLQDVEFELKRINPNIDVLKIVKDFEHAAEPGWFDDIKHTLSDVDVSLLVNNVGVTEWTSVVNTEEEKIGGSVIISSYLPAMLTRVLLPQMLSRQQRGGIVFMSSHNGLIPMGYFTTDSANKAFDDAFAMGLRQEVGDKLDVLSVAPVEAVTQGNVSKETSWRIASSDEMANSALTDLGVHWRTHGPRNQKLMTLAMLLVPQPIMSYVGTLVCKELTSRYPKGSKSL